MQRSRSWRNRVRLAGALAFLPSCGGGAALNHPAHTLPSGSVSMGAGVSGNFVLGEDAIGAGRGTLAQPGGALSSEDRRAVGKGTLVDASLSPGVAPWVGGRVGLGGTNEAGLLYSGRALRVDGRHAFESQQVAFSAGLGASAILTRSGIDADPADAPPQVGLTRAEVGNSTGFGLDLPLLIGWRSDASLVQVWAGLRAGFEMVRGSLHVTLDTVDAEPARLGYDFDAARYWGGALAGLSVGLEPIAVSIEVDAAYFAVSGSSDLVSGDVAAHGLGLVPSAALIGHF